MEELQNVEWDAAGMKIINHPASEEVKSDYWQAECNRIAIEYQKLAKENEILKKTIRILAGEID